MRFFSIEDQRSRFGLLYMFRHRRRSKHSAEKFDSCPRGGAKPGALNPLI